MITGVAMTPEMAPRAMIMVVARMMAVVSSCWREGGSGREWLNLRGRDCLRASVQDGRREAVLEDREGTICRSAKELGSAIRVRTSSNESSRGGAGEGEAAVVFQLFHPQQVGWTCGNDTAGQMTGMTNVGRYCSLLASQ